MKCWMDLFFTFLIMIGGIVMTALNRLKIILGDITTLAVDAIVNAANEGLRGGGGVDGAIHAAAGQKLYEACSVIGGCPTGEVRMTPGFNLPAKFVLHAVGPVWRGGTHNEPALLASCYRNALTLAAEKHFISVAFPSISTGIYGYPLELAAPLALREIRAFLETHEAPHEVFMVCFNEAAYRAYLEAWRRITEARGDL
jgi:O-acetyl-ADP-ribose deacetylase (regulator of RNase III)